MALRLPPVFRHVALFRWGAATTSEAVEALQQALAELPSSIQELRGYRTGPDVGLREGNWDFAVVADFDDVAGWQAYSAHPAHQRLIAELILPMLGERAAVQYEC